MPKAESLCVTGVAPAELLKGGSPSLPPFTCRPSWDCSIPLQSSVISSWVTSKSQDFSGPKDLTLAQYTALAKSCKGNTCTHTDTCVYMHTHTHTCMPRNCKNPCSKGCFRKFCQFSSWRQTMCQVQILLKWWVSVLFWSQFFCNLSQLELSNLLYNWSQAHNYMEICLVIREILTMSFGKFFDINLHLLILEF